MKIFKTISPILLILGILFFFFIVGDINNKRFFKKSIQAKIVIRNNWAVQTTYFYLEDKILIDSNDISNFDLKVNDSISKLSNTWRFNVYRKNNAGEYEFHKNYDKSK